MAATTGQPQTVILHERYELLKKLGVGNFGTAWLAQDLKENKTQKVIKQIFVGMLEPDETVDALKEAKLLGRLHHPNILMFHEAFMNGTFVCIVTEFCNDGDLDMKIKKAAEAEMPFSQPQILDWLVQLAMALQHLHERRILHRDLKTKNVFLRHGVIKLGDFGIARVMMGTMDEAKTFAGTPYYMSPEALQSSGYNSKSDIWALGCVLFECCSLRQAFNGDSLMKVMYQICEGEPPKIPDNYDDSLRNLAYSLLVRDPKERPSAVQILQQPFMLKHIERMKFKISRKTEMSIEKEREDIAQAVKEKMEVAGRRKVLQRGQRLDTGASSPPDDFYDSTPRPRQQSSVATLSQSNEHSDGGLGSTIYDDEDEYAGLTPKEKMARKKQKEADMRARELKEAAVKQGAENRTRMQHIDRSRLDSAAVAEAISPGVKKPSRPASSTSSSSIPPPTPAYIPSNSASSSRAERSPTVDVPAIAREKSPVRREAPDYTSHDDRPLPTSARRVANSASIGDHDYLGLGGAHTSSRESTGDSLLAPPYSRESASESRGGSAVRDRSPQPARKPQPPWISEHPDIFTSGEPDDSFLVRRNSSGSGHGRASVSAHPTTPRSGAQGHSARKMSPSEAALHVLDDSLSSSSLSASLGRGGSARSISSSRIPELAASAEAYYNSEGFESPPHSDDEEASHHDLVQLQSCMSDALKITKAAEADEELCDPEPLRTERMAALRRQGQQLLGSKFTMVYEYLKAAQQRNASQEEIKAYLEKKVNYNDCFVVVQLTYLEQPPQSRKL